MNRRAQLICAWCGPACAALFALGAVFLGQFIPPLVDPGDGPQEVARKWAEHTDSIRIGALITIVSMSLVAPWGVSVAAQTRRTEGRFPILTYVQLMCIAVGTTVVVLMSMFWCVAASLWTALLFVPAGLMAFFKTGPFAWNGLMALYVPVGVFFVWLAVLTFNTIKNINRGFAHVPLPEDIAWQPSKSIERSPVGV